jgi:hypothetical protein
MSGGKFYREMQKERYCTDLILGTKKPLIIQGFFC